MLDADIRLLEDRVRQVLARLRDLSAARDEHATERSVLQSELVELRSRIGDLEASRDEDAERMRDVRDVLREAIRELRRP